PGSVLDSTDGCSYRETTRRRPYVTGKGKHHRRSATLFSTVGYLEYSHCAPNGRARRGSDSAWNFHAGTRSSGGSGCDSERPRAEGPAVRGLRDRVSAGCRTDCRSIGAQG